MPRKRRLPEGMVTRPGRKGYYADFFVGGRRVQKKLGTDFEAARTNLRQLRARAEKGEFGLLDNDYPISDLKDAFLKRCQQELRPRSAARYRQSLEIILGWLGFSKVRQIESEKIMDFREHRLRKVCPATVNFDVLALNAMLNWGVEKNRIGSNPLGKIKPLLHDRPKEGRALADDEVRRLLERSKQPWRDIWYALLVTGMRRDELANLLFSDIDWDNRELIVRSYRAKGKRERRVPIEDGLLEILVRQRASCGSRKPGTATNQKVAGMVRERFTKDHVFVTSQNTPLTNSASFYNAFLRSCGRADIQTQTYDAEGHLIEHVDIHSLRRTFATNAIVNGADPKSVQEILGHSTLDMTMRIYTKVKGASKRQTLGKLSYAQGATPPAHIIPMSPATGGPSLPPSLPVEKTGSGG